MILRIVAIYTEHVYLHDLIYLYGIYRLRKKLLSLKSILDGNSSRDNIYNMLYMSCT